MKRIEMVEKSLVLEDLFKLESVTFYMKMDAALLFFEEAGMFPPKIESSYKKFGRNVYRENNYWGEENLPI